MKYKVGDKVRIKSLEWYEANKDEQGNILCIAPSGRKCYFMPELSPLCGKEVVIKDIFNQLDAGFYFIQGYEGYAMTDEMIEEIGTPDNKPLFTLTAEEVEFLNYTLYWLLDERYFDNDKETSQARNLLTRIKQWQDENK